MAVRRGLGARFERNHGVRSGTVVDDHGLRQRFGKRLADAAHESVHHAARRIGNDHVDRFGRIGLRVQGRSEREREQRKWCGGGESHVAISPR